MDHFEANEHWVLHPDALFCALVLAPECLPRNRFFKLYEHPEFAAARKRARRVRGIVNQLLEHGQSKAEIVGEQVMVDGQAILSYRVNDLAFGRTTALGALDAAALRYALYRAGASALNEEDRALVCDSLRKLGELLPLLPAALRAEVGQTVPPPAAPRPEQ
jgi:hypothetical protein